MKTSSGLWKECLQDRLPQPLGAEIDKFESEVLLKKQGKIDDKVFAETRLRRGCYGQRYDNGQRHDGKKTQKLDYPSDNSKGPGTRWDAPGMQRIKIPYGGLNAGQLEMLAGLSEEYSDGIAHITTRQDFQLHFVHIEDTPAMMRRLASVGITTREACGNTLRNVTGCPLAGVCRTEAFDVTPYAKALAWHLLGHPDTQEFGRKFKISFSGCAEEACALAHIHDIGAVAAVRDGKRGFAFYVGGGLGTVPQQAKLMTDFVPEHELLPVAQAICRVFARLGEKKNRNTARLKFVIQKIGLEEFRRLVALERSTLKAEPRWTEYLKEVPAYREEARKPGALLEISGAHDVEFKRWRESNVYEQKQSGYVTVTVALPLGDITADQLRAVADLARKYTRETIRSTVEQNLVLRWVSAAELPSLYEELKAAELAQPGAGTIVDIVACPGTDTCKLGISSSRGLAAELRARLVGKGYELDEAIRGLHIKISGCFNSCGQHHVADLGFYGVSRNKNGYTVPHFQLVLGGKWEENAGSYGLAIGAVPSRRIPETVDRITSRYLTERQGGETFHDYAKRIGKAALKAMIDDLTSVPPHDVDAGYYVDWSDAREYTIGDIGIGECAGEVVTPIEFQLTACEREAFEAQLALEAGEIGKATRVAYESMRNAALALLAWRLIPHDSTPDGILAAFKHAFYDTEYFFDPFTGGKFAQYYFAAHEERSRTFDSEQAHRLIEEAQLFIEASHACYGRLSAQKVVAA
jgi:sulfite reductase (ferredoxin)